MYKLTVKLKQHTPLIHFQHDQEGATLRATEVKPKLDRFIINKLKKLKPEIFSTYRDLINTIPDEQNPTRSSPYKMQITQDEKVIKYIIASNLSYEKKKKFEKEGYNVLGKSPYFADNQNFKEDNLEEAKLGIMLDNVSLCLKYFDPRWENLFNEVIPLFFTSTNFGSRQNKGFGCFLPVELTQIEFEDNLKLLFPSVFCLPLKNNGIDGIFQEIDSVYKKLKSGDRKTDSELRKYFNNLRPMVEWEKPSIQEVVSDISRQRMRINAKTNNKQFVRALLGLPELYEYPRNRIKVQVKNEQIDRYASPILFKVFNKNIYILPDNKESIEGSIFKFEFKDGGRSYGEKLTLKVPERFNLTEFLERSLKTMHSWYKLQ